MRESVSRSFVSDLRQGCESIFGQDLAARTKSFVSPDDWAKFGLLLSFYQGRFSDISKSVYEELDEQEQKEFLKWFLLRWAEINILPQPERDEYEQKFTGVNSYPWSRRKINGIERIVVDLKEKYGFLYLYDRSYKTISDGAWLLCDFLHDQYRFNGVEVKEGDVIIDAGAYLGETALLFSHQLKGRCSIHSFEISPVNYETMLDNLKINGMNNVCASRLALASESGKELSFTHVQGATSLSVSQEIKEERYSVRTVSLDDYVQEKSLNKVDFIKMDIEGAEMDALRGSQETIKKFKPKLAICIYHLPADPYEIPRYIKSLNPDYRFHFNWYAKRNGADAILYCSMDGHRLQNQRLPSDFDQEGFDEIVYRSLFAMTHWKAGQDEKYKALHERLIGVYRSKTYRLAEIFSSAYQVFTKAVKR